MQIVNLAELDDASIHQAANLLVDGFREHWPEAWPDQESALRDVREALSDDWICLAAVSAEGAVIGWIAGAPQYSGHVWELHPLVVREDCRGQGIGRELVRELESRVAGRGGLTLWLGTDDEDNMTSLGGADLFPEPLTHLSRLRDLRGHPFGFYLKLGFSVVGVLPDANGFGKPDIFMAKRVSP